MFERLPLVGRLYRHWVQPIAGSLSSWALLRYFSWRAGVPSNTKLDTHTVHAAYHPIEAEKVSCKKTGSEKGLAAAAIEAVKHAVGSGTDADHEGEEATTGKTGPKHRSQSEKKQGQQQAAKTASGERKDQ